MVDIFTPSKRSEVMAHIKGKNTKPELAIRKILFSKGLRYRLHPKDLPGKPDIVFRSSRVAIFVNGCFWHQHKNCKDASVPSSRKDYWLPKLERNAQRDSEAVASLEKMGWEVHIIWECFFKDSELIEKMAKRIFIFCQNKIKSNNKKEDSRTRRCTLTARGADLLTEHEAEAWGQVCC